MSFDIGRDFASALAPQIDGKLRPYLRQALCSVVAVGSGANTGQVRVRLPGEDILTADLPWAPVYGAVPAVSDVVRTFWDHASRFVVTTSAGGGGGVTSFETRTGAVVSAAGDYTATEITNTPAGSIAAVTVQAAITELDADHTAHLNDTVDAHDASAISYAGGTGMSATEVESAIDELATEKLDVGTGTQDATTFRRGDGTWATPPGGGSFVLPTTAPASDGEISYDATREFVRFYDGVRERSVSEIGWMPFAYTIGLGSSSTTTTANNIAAVGGTMAAPIVLEGHMLLQSISYWDTTAANARGPVEFAIYEDRLDNSNTLNLVAGAVGTLATYTPTVASKRTISVTSPPVYLAPGVYWVVIKNNHASALLGIGCAAAGTMAKNVAQTKTLTTAAFGSTLDFVAATWTKITTMPGWVLEGRVFGQTAAF